MSRPPPSEDATRMRIRFHFHENPPNLKLTTVGEEERGGRSESSCTSSLGGGLLMRVPTWRRSASSCASSLGGSLHPHAHSHLTAVCALPPVTGFFTWKKLEQDVCRRGTWRRLYLSALVHVSSSLFDLTRGATTSLECPSLCILLLS